MNVSTNADVPPKPQVTEPQELNRGHTNCNPAGIGFWALVAEDFVTHDRDFFAQGFWALFWHRFGNWRMAVRPRALRLPLSLIYKVMFKMCEWWCGIMLPYTTHVGRRVKLEHFGGMILVAQSIGNDVIIRQNTTFGLAGTKSRKERPVIGDHVDIGTGAVLVGAVTVGPHTVIGANSVVTRDLPPHCVAAGVPARVLKTYPPKRHVTQDAAPGDPVIGAVLIGRNEGARLIACLASLGDRFAPVVYVDSGSTDGSVASAQAAGAQVVVLDTDTPFTAARARNAGITALRDGQSPDLVQFIDGDCALDPDWIDQATGFLADHPKVAVVCGRRRERAPDASVYNRMCDAEWDTPLGEAAACGGDALMRMAALTQVDGYNPDLIAGEEPEMCLRMRRAGWQVWRLDAEMTLHDADMHRFGQFWKRAQRAGYAGAEGAAMYGRGPERHGVAATRRALLWGGAIPLVIVLAALLLGPWALLGLAVYPAQVIRLARRDGGHRFAWEQAALLTVGKFAETRGIISYYWRRWRGQTAQLIEYKS